MYRTQDQSWLALVTLCLCAFVITGPQTSEAAPSLTSYVMVRTGVSSYFQLTFSEPVTISTINALTINGYYTEYIDVPIDLQDPNGPTMQELVDRYPSYQASTITSDPPQGNFSLYMKVTLGNNERAHFFPLSAMTPYLTSISLGTGFAASMDSVPSLPSLSPNLPHANFTIADNIVPSLSSFSYDVSSGVVRLRFTPHIMFTSLNTSGITLTNNSGMTIPLAPVSSSPDPSVDPYTGVQLKLPVETVVTLATSPWIGANISLLHVTVPAAAVANFLGGNFAATVTRAVTNLTRDCYNRSTYFNASTGDCQPCDPTCLTCKGPLPYPDPTSGCTDCSVVLVTGSSSYQCRRGNSCPDGYYRSNSHASSPVTTPGSLLCLPCTPSCFQCSSNTTCTSCTALLPSQPTQCCDNTTGTCMACNSSCTGGCRGPLNTDCIYCRELNYTQNGTTSCLSTCPLNTYRRGVLCLTCASNVSEVLCPPDPCWLGFEYNRDTYKCQLIEQFRYIIIPATAGGGGLLIITCGFLCLLCWFCPGDGPDTSSKASKKRAYTNPTFSPETRSVINPLLT